MKDGLGVVLAFLQRLGDERKTLTAKHLVAFLHERAEAWGSAG